MQIRQAARRAAMVGVSFLVLTLAACGGKQPPVARPTPPPPPAPTTTAPAAKPPAPPEPVAEQPPVVPPEPIQEDTLSSSSLDALNRNSPFKDVFFEFDSGELSADARAACSRTRSC